MNILNYVAVFSTTIFVRLFRQRTPRVSRYLVPSQTTWSTVFWRSSMYWDRMGCPTCSNTTCLSTASAFKRSPTAHSPFHFFDTGRQRLSFSFQLGHFFTHILNPEVTRDTVVHLSQRAPYHAGHPLACCAVKPIQICFFLGSHCIDNRFKESQISLGCCVRCLSSVPCKSSESPQSSGLPNTRLEGCTWLQILSVNGSLSFSKSLIRFCTSAQLIKQVNWKTHSPMSISPSVAQILCRLRARKAAATLATRGPNLSESRQHRGGGEKR
jgi:hypothetical protein